MASDVDDLATFYASLPSIFENNSVTNNEPIHDKPSTPVDNIEPTYKPMFGSFLFSNSDPLTRAAFVASSSSSNSLKVIEEQRLHQDDGPSSIQTDSSNGHSSSFPPRLAVSEDIQDTDDDAEEDDFDGIPIRHSTNLIKNKINGDSDSYIAQNEQEHFLNQFVHRIDVDDPQSNPADDNDDDDDDDEDDEDAFLNGFSDDQHPELISAPALFKDIPDIDDPNEHDDDLNDGIPFDRMDMLDQSDSIRSPSPDSLLSSSHLRDDEDDDVGDEIDNDEMNHFNGDDDDDENDDDDVTQWNDDFLLSKTNIEQNRPNAPSPSRLFLNMHPHDQVDFIDSSRSASRCSQASSHFSTGYTDQARIIIDDDGLETSSESDDDHDDEDKYRTLDDHQPDPEDNVFDREPSDEELSLQIDLDPRPSARSRSLSQVSSNISQNSRSSSPIVPDQSPIIDMDEEIYEPPAPLTIAPMAQVDDDDEEEGGGKEKDEHHIIENDEENLSDLRSFHSYQPVLPNFLWKNLMEIKREELVRDIVDIRNIYRDHEDDDEFLAVMHNPMIFEEVLTDTDDQTSKFDGQVKGSNALLRTSSNSLEHTSIEQNANSSSTSVPPSEKKNENNSPSSISFCPIIITNNRPVTHVNHLVTRKEEKEEDASVIDPSILEQKTEEIQFHQQKTTNSLPVQFPNGHTDQSIDQKMSSEDESENDSELFHTLAQIHGLVQPPGMSFDDSIQLENESSNINSLPSDSDRMEKKHAMSHYNPDVVSNVDQTMVHYSLSLTSSTSSSSSSLHFTDDELPINDENRENEIGPLEMIQAGKTLFNDSLLNDNQFQPAATFYPDDQSVTTAVAVVTTTTTETTMLVNSLKSSMDLSTMTNDFSYDQSSFDHRSSNDQYQNSQMIRNENQDDLISYLHWIIGHLKDESKPASFDKEIAVNQQSDKQLIEENVASQLKPIVEKLINTSVQLALTDVYDYQQQAEQMVNHIFTQAIDQLYHQDMKHLLTRDDRIPDDQTSISINTHLATSSESQVFDPFDHRFDHLWSQQFQTPDHTTVGSDIFTIDHQAKLDSSWSDQINLKETFPSNSTMTMDDLMKSCLAPTVKSNRFDDSSRIPENRTVERKTGENDEESTPIDQPTMGIDTDPEQSDSDTESETKITNTINNNIYEKEELTEGFRQPQFRAFASEQPLRPHGIDSIVAGIEDEFAESSTVQSFNETKNDWPGENTDEPSPDVKQEPTVDDAPWELDESGDENEVSPNQANNVALDPFNSFFPPAESDFSKQQRSSSLTTSDSEDERPEESDNYDKYFSEAALETAKNPETSLPKTVHFGDEQTEVEVFPKDSLNGSEASGSDNDDVKEQQNDDDQYQIDSFPVPSDRIADHMNVNGFENDYTPRTALASKSPRVDSEISLTSSDDLPPPLPQLPPMLGKTPTSNEHIPVKATSWPTESKSTSNLRPESEVKPNISTLTMTDVNLYKSSETSLLRSAEPAILRSTSTDPTSTDPDDLNDVIQCVIDNNSVKIDAKTISPFKCIIAPAGHLKEDGQTTIIAIYGCWLPDHRLREYRYIMDQLFYYVYQKIDKLVNNDYILVYFHGATPKHRTPELKFLRKCYQMINFRLRKNLRAVYVVHPTRWLRTVIALSRPFFSNKFYHKVHYLFTIAELERQFPDNPLSIPVIIEQFDIHQSRINHFRCLC